MEKVKSLTKVRKASIKKQVRYIKRVFSKFNSKVREEYYNNISKIHVLVSRTI